MQNQFDAQEQAIQKRIAQSQALRSQGFTPARGQISGGVYIRPDFSESLAQGLRMYGGMKEGQSAEQELQTLKSERAGANQSAMANALRMMGGAPADAALPEGVAGPVRGAQAPDLRGAYGELMKSPDYAQMGQQGMVGMAQEQAKRAQAQAENQRVMGILQSVKSPQEAIAAGVPVDTVKSFFEAGNIGKEKGVVINGQLVNPLTGESIGGPIAKQADLSSDLLIPDGKGGLMVNKPLLQAKKEVAEAGRAPAAERQVQTMQTDQGMFERVNGRWEPITAGGKPVMPKGAAGAGNATEGERKAATLLQRMQGSEAQLESALLKDKGAAKPGLISSGLSAIGMGTLANTATPENRQKVEAAQLDILDAALTLGTGAAYTKEQLEGYRKSYFPQLGDKPETVKDKQDRLNNVLSAARIAAGRAGSQVPTPVAPGAPAAPKARMKFDAQGNPIQ